MTIIAEIERFQPITTVLHELENGKSVIGVADAIELLQALPNDSIDLLLTDIPYGRVNKPSAGLRIIDKKEANEETFNLDEFASEVLRVTKSNAVIFCGKEQFSPLFQHFDERGLTTRMIVWEKTNPSPMNGSAVFLSGVECAVHFRKKRAPFNGHHQNTVFRFPNGRSSRHPTEKPLNMFKRFIEILSNQGDLVCDPCAGSGTAAVAAHQLERKDQTQPPNGKAAIVRRQAKTTAPPPLPRYRKAAHNRPNRLASENADENSFYRKHSGAVAADSNNRGVAAGRIHQHCQSTGADLAGRQ